MEHFCRPAHSPVEGRRQRIDVTAKAMGKTQPISFTKLLVKKEKNTVEAPDPLVGFGNRLDAYQPFLHGRRADETGHLSHRSASH